MQTTSVKYVDAVDCDGDNRIVGLAANGDIVSISAGVARLSGRQHSLNPIGTQVPIADAEWALPIQLV